MLQMLIVWNEASVEETTIIKLKFESVRFWDASIIITPIIILEIFSI